MDKAKKEINPKIAKIIEEFVEEAHLFWDIDKPDWDVEPMPKPKPEHPPYEKPEASEVHPLDIKLEPIFTEALDIPPTGDIDKRLMDYSKEYTSNKPYSKDLPRPEDHNR